ncbi:TVP38/TMEM64 family protein [Anaerobacillus sp. MEB173]|uniref:TVP38/TMEM64 family protein n=1 Tax=Anaerobacillus sp. MEB173 TaxID=3383345 RepID=UPI003F902FD1
MKKVKWIILIMFVILVVWLLNTDEMKNLTDENIYYFTEELREQVGYSMLWITIPLAILQGVVTAFPFILILIIHISLFGLVQGIFFSWIGSLIGALVCFVLSRYFFDEVTHKLWDERKKNHQKWRPFIDLYGVWAIILLRSIPVIPSNVISIMAALSPIGIKAYFWSTVVGNKSMIWLLTLISSPVTFPGRDISIYLISYFIFCFVLVFILFHQHRMSKRKKKEEILILNNQDVSQ